MKKAAEVAVRVAPSSLLFTYNVLSPIDDVDKAWTPAYAEISNVVESKGNYEIKQLLVAQVVKDKTRIVTIVCGLLYGILARPEFASTCYDALAFVSMSQYAYGVACDNLHHVVMHRFPELLPAAKAQLIWVIGAMMQDNVREVEPLGVVLLRWVAGWDRSPGNIEMAESVVNLLVTNKDYVIQRRELLRHTVYGFLRLLLDHGCHPKLSDKAAAFCAAALRERKADLLGMGRDMVRAFQEVSHVTHIREAWLELQIGDAAADQGLDSALAVETKKSYIKSRVTPRLEQWLSFLLTKATGKQEIFYLTWLNAKYFAQPELAETLVVDIIRYICCCIPSPANIHGLHGPVPRWRLVVHLLLLIKTQKVLESAKLALFWDWIMYRKGGQLSLLEPGAMVMQSYMDKHGGKLRHVMRCSMLEFLAQASGAWQQLIPAQTVADSITAAFTACFESGILRSTRRILDNTAILGPDLSNVLKASLPGLFTELRPTHDSKMTKESTTERALELRSSKSPPPGGRSDADIQAHVTGHSATDTNEQRLLKRLLKEGWSEVPSRKAVLFAAGAGIQAARIWLVEHMDDADFSEPLPHGGNEANRSRPASPAHGTETRHMRVAGRHDDKWEDAEVLHDHGPAEADTGKRVLPQREEKNVKRLRTEVESETGDRLLTAINDIEQLFSSVDMQNLDAVTQFRSAILDIISQLRLAEVLESMVTTLASVLTRALHDAPGLFVAEDLDALAGMEERPARLYPLLGLLYPRATDEMREADARAWFLNALYTHGIEDVGTCLLAYLSDRDMDIAPYMAFCETFADELSMPQCIARDGQACSDYEVQCGIMVHVFKQLDWLAGDVALITLLMSAMDGRHMYHVRCQVTQGRMRVFSDETLVQLLEDSLNWEAMEAHNLYQLLHATALHATTDVSTALAAVLPRLCPAEHPEAMGGFLLVMSALRPTPAAVVAVLMCSSNLDPFPECALLQWSALEPEQLAASIPVALETLESKDRSRAVEILEIILEYQAAEFREFWMQCSFN